MHGAPPSQQLHNWQVSSSQPPASGRAFQPAQGSGPDAAARLALGPYSTASVQAYPAATAGLQQGHKLAGSMHLSQQEGPALQQTLFQQQTGQVSGISMPIGGAKQPAQAALGVKPESQAQALAGGSLPRLCRPALQHQETPLPTSSSGQSGWHATLQPGYTRPASAARATDTAATSGADLADAKPIQIEAGPRVEDAVRAGAVGRQAAVQPSEVMCKARPPSSSSNLEQSDAIPGSQALPDATCQAKVSSQGMAAMPSFVPQALHRLASKCSSQKAGESLQADRVIQGPRLAQVGRAVQAVTSAHSREAPQVDRPAQLDRSAQPDKSAQAERVAQAERATQRATQAVAAQAEGAAQADKAVPMRAHPYGILTHTLTSHPQTWHWSSVALPPRHSSTACCHSSGSSSMPFSTRCSCLALTAWS